MALPVELGLENANAHTGRIALFNSPPPLLYFMNIALSLLIFTANLVHNKLLFRSLFKRLVFSK
jgi:hypothetical protein